MEIYNMCLFNALFYLVKVHQDYRIKQLRSFSCKRFAVYIFLRLLLIMFARPSFLFDQYRFCNYHRHSIYISHDLVNRIKLIQFIKYEQTNLILFSFVFFVLRTWLNLGSRYEILLLLFKTFRPFLL